MREVKYCTALLVLEVVSNLVSYACMLLAGKYTARIKKVIFAVFKFNFKRV